LQHGEKFVKSARFEAPAFKTMRKQYSWELRALGDMAMFFSIDAGGE
jgi:hypothetical protein